ncbi:MAG: hypothetical protein BGO31_08535 [Bacteroidetes bacterium 43-16]|nr:MAG: hypothetical protein BGO31_08535 [Bacteroidetes bacterium 43-16]
MTLIPAGKERENRTEVKISTGTQHIEACKPVSLNIAITEQGRNVMLDVVHEKKLHLLIVNEELSWFDHIHPEEQQDGTYHISEIFPAAGKYLLFTDYKPGGSAQEVNTHHIEVSGATTAIPQRLETKLASIADGYTVFLLNGDELTTNHPQDLRFSIVKDCRILQAKDMQPYLGANAHIVMISRVDYDFLHIHPIADPIFPIYAETIIKKAGLYRMWVQFKVNDVVHTADFTVTVSRGEQAETNHKGAHH